MTNRRRPSVVAVMGPTASGKTQLAIRLAASWGGEVISVDSSLVYRGMDIGTARASLEEMAGVPHHLIDILDPAESFSAGQFRERALRLIEAIQQRGRLPILAGGTMLYFNALFRGMADLPEADVEVRRQIDDEAARFGWAHVHAELGRADPAAAQRIHPNDPQRIQRALEVYRLTGRSLTELCARHTAEPFPFLPLKIVVAPGSRANLHERIRERFRRMLDQGLIDEVRRLFERGDLHEMLPSIRAVGYRQVWSYLKGACDEDSMIEHSIIATRQLAKRQHTWLRREDDAARFVSEDRDLLDRVLRHLGSHLGG